MAAATPLLAPLAASPPHLSWWMSAMHWSCSRCMMRVHTVVLPLAVPPATPVHACAHATATHDVRARACMRCAAADLPALVVRYIIARRPLRRAAAAQPLANDEGLARAPLEAAAGAAGPAALAQAAPQLLLHAIHLRAGLARTQPAARRRQGLHRYW